MLLYQRIKDFLTSFSTSQGFSSYCLLIQKEHTLEIYIYRQPEAKVSLTCNDTKLLDKEGEYVLLTSTLISVLKLLHQETLFQVHEGMIKISTDRFKFVLNLLFREDYPFQSWSWNVNEAVESEALGKLLRITKSIYSFSDREDMFISIQRSGKHVFAVTPGSFYFGCSYFEFPINLDRLSLNKEQYLLLNTWLRLIPTCALQQLQNSILLSHQEENMRWCMELHLYDLYESLETYWPIMNLEPDIRLSRSNIKDIVDAGKVILSNTSNIDCLMSVRNDDMRVKFYLPTKGESNVSCRIDNFNHLDFSCRLDFVVLLNLLNRVNTEILDVKVHHEASALIFFSGQDVYLIAFQLG